MRRKGQMFYSAIMLTGVNLLLRLISTSFQVYISGKMGPEGVGLLQLVLSVGMLSMTAGMAGIRTSTMYLTAEELGRKKPGNVKWVLRGCFLYSLAASGLVGAMLYSFSPSIARDWIGNVQSVGAIRLFALFLPITCMCGVMTGYFTAANRIGTLAAVEIAEQLCSMGVTMTALTLWAEQDAGRACCAVVLGSGVGACLTLACLSVLRLRERNLPESRIRITGRLLNTAVPLALADDLKAGISTTENLMVPKRLALYPGSTSPLAAFGTVSGMVFPVLMFPASILFALAELLIPELARCAAAESRTRIRYLVRRSLRVAMLYGLLCGGLLYLLAEPLCTELYSSTDAAMHLRRFALLAPMLYCDAIVDAMTKGLGQQKICVRYNILTSAMDVVLLYLLLPRWGMDGYFVSFLVTHLLNFILSLQRLMKIVENRIPFYIPALSAAATLAAAWGASTISNIPGRILAFLGLLGSLLVLLRVVSREDLTWLKGLVQKR